MSYGGRGAIKLDSVVLSLPPSLPLHSDQKINLKLSKQAHRTKPRLIIQSRVHHLFSEKREREGDLWHLPRRIFTEDDHNSYEIFATTTLFVIEAECQQLQGLLGRHIWKPLCL